MIGVLISSKIEWKTLLEIYNIDDSHLEKYPYGEFYRTIFRNKDIVFFRIGIRKVNAASATQYMIDRFSLEKIIVIGTSTAVNDSYNYLDVISPERIIDYDFILRDLTVEIPEEAYIEMPKMGNLIDFLLWEENVNGLLPLKRHMVLEVEFKISIASYYKI